LSEDEQLDEEVDEEVVGSFNSHTDTGELNTTTHYYSVYIIRLVLILSRSNDKDESRKHRVVVVLEGFFIESPNRI
jgi:hypothetical protein